MRNKKIEKIHAKENNYIHKTIFTWFGNLPTSTKLQGFHYYQGKIKSAATMFFFFFLSLKKHDNNKTLISKLGFLDPAHIIHNGLQNRQKFFPRSKPPLHGLNLKKSPIKNHTILFGDRKSVV